MQNGGTPTNLENNMLNLPTSQDIALRIIRTRPDRLDSIIPTANRNTDGPQLIKMAPKPQRTESNLKSIPMKHVRNSISQ